MLRRPVLVDHDTGIGLLNSGKYKSRFLQLFYSFFIIQKCSPWDVLLGPNCCFGDFGPWRQGSVTGEPKLFDSKSISRTKSCSNIMKASDVVQPENQVFFEWRCAVKISVENFFGAKFFQWNLNISEGFRKRKIEK